MTHDLYHQKSETCCSSSILEKNNGKVSAINENAYTALPVLFVHKDAPKVSGYSLLTGLTRQTITPFFSPKNLPSAATHFAMWQNHLFHSSAQVDLGMT